MVKVMPPVAPVSAKPPGTMPPRALSGTFSAAPALTVSRPDRVSRVSSRVWPFSLSQALRTVM